MKQDYTIINKIMEIDNNYIDDKAINRVKKYLVAPLSIPLIEDHSLR